MAQPVKRRSYRSIARAQSAAHTRERILSAARRLFRTRSYSATKIEDIASAARVSPATVYLAFGSKRTIVLALSATVGAIPEAQRLNELILNEPDLSRRLVLAAKITRVITQSAWDLMEMARAGASIDPDLAAAWRRGTEARHETVAAALQDVLADGGVEGSAAVDIVWALTGPDLYGALVVERGWSADRYESLLAQLLVAAVGARRPRRKAVRARRTGR